MKKNYLSNRLFAEPSFVEGVSRIFDLGNTLQQYNVSKSEEEADFEALRDDWRAVGNDLKSSIKTYEQQELTKSA